MNYVELKLYSETYYNKNYENHMMSLVYFTGFFSQVERNIVHILSKKLCIDWKLSTEHTVVVGHV